VCKFFCLLISGWSTFHHCWIAPPEQPNFPFVWIWNSTCCWRHGILLRTQRLETLAFRVTYKRAYLLTYFTASEVVTLLLLLLQYKMPRYFIPGVIKLANVKMYVRNGYDKDSETVNVLARFHNVSKWQHCKFDKWRWCKVM